MENQSVKFSIEVTRAQFRAAVLFSADKDIRYYLNGVCLHVGECGDARLIGCDGHRLGIVKLCDASSATPGEYLMPRDTIKAIKKAGRYDVPLMLNVDGDRFTLVDQAGGAIVGGDKLIDGKFPDWQRVTPDPSTMDGTPGAFNASYLADIQKALNELGDKWGAFAMLQNGPNNSCLVARVDLGFMAVVMPIKAGDMPTAADVAAFSPRVMPRAVVETAAGGQAFPCDALQDVTDKRRQELPAPPAVVMVDIDAPAVVAHCGADMAAWIDPAGALQAAGLLIVAHVGDAPSSAPNSKRTILESGVSNRHGTAVNLIHATAGEECAGAGTRQTAEKWGAIFDHGGTDSGTWYASEEKARAEFNRVTMPDDSAYSDYLASIAALSLQAAA